MRIDPDGVTVEVHSPLRKGLMQAAVVVGLLVLWPLYLAANPPEVEPQPAWQIPELCAFRDHGAMLNDDGSVPDGCEPGMPEHFLQYIPGKADIAMRHALAWVDEKDYPPDTPVELDLDAVPPWETIEADVRSSWVPVERGELARLERDPQTSPEHLAWMRAVQKAQPKLRKARADWVFSAKKLREFKLQQFLKDQAEIRASNASISDQRWDRAMDGLIVAGFLELLMFVLFGLRFMLPVRHVRLHGRRLDLLERQVPLDQIERVARTHHGLTVHLVDGSHVDLPEMYAVDAGEIDRFIEVIEHQIARVKDEGVDQEQARRALGRLASQAR